MFFKNKEVEFFCRLPEVQKQYPIVSAQQTKFSWMKESVKQYKKLLHNTGHRQSVTSTVKCPGIKPAMSLGYTLRSWFDFTIRTTEDPNKFEYFVNEKLNKYLMMRNYNAKLVSWFSSEDKNHGIPLAKNDLQSLIKLDTPWYVKIPKGYKLIIMPVPYADETAFSSVYGVLDSAQQYSLNVILKWHNRPGETFVPAGTPLCQLLPIKDTAIPIKIKDWTIDNFNAEAEDDYIAMHRFKPK